ncbi:hypothetical protein HK099_001893 [Clydaea vesicula]|uniref:Endonuclease/exonuclease/phosphatase domain-containing protein n=1 Tax=Clydaea vesicula TaxID=447962 RepID=A0AAD5Y1N1_9FUNG|nr:hypothetical protein HK099_001893 [Clydaea vesicula]
MIRRSKRIVQYTKILNLHLNELNHICRYYSKEERSVDSPKKKAKKKSEIRIPNTFYTNVKMPSTYEFGSLKENEIKLLSYNVAGLNASINKGLKEYLLAENADVFFLQETKLSHNLVEPLLDEKIYPYHSGEKLRRLAYKVEFNKEIESYVKNLELRKPIVWGGDFNVSHTENDLSRPKANMK